MARHIWSVLCHKDLLDSKSKQVSLIDVIEKITLPQEEFFQEAARLGLEPGQMATQGFAFAAPTRLVSFWTRSDPVAPEVFEFRIRQLAPSGKLLAHQVVRVSLENHRNSRPTIHFEGFIFAGEGIYSIAVDKRDAGKDRFTRQATLPLEIDVKPASEMAVALPLLPQASPEGGGP